MKWYDKNEYQDPRTWKNAQEQTVRVRLILMSGAVGFIIGTVVMTLLRIWGTS